jgi:hypothetical protein
VFGIAPVVLTVATIVIAGMSVKLPAVHGPGRVQTIVGRPVVSQVQPVPAAET